MRSAPGWIYDGNSVRPESRAGVGIDRSAADTSMRAIRIAIYAVVFVFSMLSFLVIFEHGWPSDARQFSRNISREIDMFKATFRAEQDTGGARRQ